MLPSVVEGVYTIIRNQKKRTSECSKLEDSVNEIDVVLSDHNVTALNLQTSNQNHQSFLHGGNITEPSSSTEVFNLNIVGMTEKELVEASVLPRTKHEFDSDVICAVTDKVVVMNKTKMFKTVDKIMYWCNFCSCNFYKKEELLQHIMMHRFRCHKCAFQSFSRAAAIQHSVDEHGGLKSTALKFCALYTDITKCQNTEKRKQSDDCEPVAKRRCLEEGGTTNDIQDKVASNKVNADSNPKSIDVSGRPEANPKITDVISGHEAIPIITDVISGHEANPKITDVISGHEAIPKITDVISGHEAIPVIKDVISGHEAIPKITDVISGHEAIPKITDVISGHEAIPKITDVISGHEAIPKIIDVISGPEAIPIITDVISGHEAIPKITDVISGHEALNEYVSSMSNSPMGSSKTTAITKNISESSPSAMECLTTTAESSETSQQSTRSNISVSSALSWNCGYCCFVTLKPTFLRLHMNAKHAKHPHNYVASIVTREEEMKKIKASDVKFLGIRKLIKRRQRRLSLVSKFTKTKLAGNVNKIKKSSYPEFEIGNAESDAKSEAQKAEDENIFPISYKCPHCNYNASDSSLVKVHLLKTHVGHVLYGLDMKAVRLRKKRYIFYCLKDTCQFETKETGEYFEHITTCMNDESELSSVIMMSLDLTKKFMSVCFDRSTKTIELANYSCNYCSFKASNICLKEHVLSNHVDQSRICSKLNLRQGTKELVHFCEHCLWESDNATGLKLHLANKHTKSIEGKILSNPNFSKETPQAAEAKTKPVSPLNENDEHDYEDDDEHLSSNFAESYYSEHVPEEEHINALSRYLAEHGTKSRPTRHAALKCLKNMRKASLPPLYACTHCSSFEYGSKRMSLHLNTKHADEILLATNVMNKSHNPLMKDAFFCPKSKCYYSAPNPADLWKHAHEYHNMKKTDEYFQRLQVTFSDDKATVDDNQTSCKSECSPSNKTYQCLHCSEPAFDKIADMKNHLVKSHSCDIFTYSDCFAQKQGQPSTFFMCHFLTCDFITDKQHDYLLHMLGHQKARIYECSLCQWFSCEKGEIIGHQNSAHEGKPVRVLDIDLDINEHCKIVRHVVRTVIKKENS